MNMRALSWVRAHAAACYTLMICAASACTDYATIVLDTCPNCLTGGASQSDAPLGVDCSERDCPPAPQQSGCGDAGCATAPGDAGSASENCSPGEYPLLRELPAVLLLVDLSSGLLASWPKLQIGLNDYIHRAAPRGLRVGLQIIGSSCEQSDYAALTVPIAQLSSNADAITNAAATSLLEFSSKLPALRGSIAAARSWALANGETFVTMAALTDGFPGPCDPLDTYETDVKAIVRAAYLGTPQVRLHAIGFGEISAVGVLAAGSETKTYQIATLTPESEVVAALQAIVSSAPSCSFTAADSAPVTGMSVVVTTRDGTQQRYPLALAAEDCANSAGFYTVSDRSPVRIVACPEVCSKLHEPGEFELGLQCD